MGILDRIKNKLTLMFDLSRVNFKIALITVIGLVLALSLSAGFLIYLDSSKADVYMQAFQSESVQNGLTVRIIDDDDRKEFVNMTEDRILNISQQIENYVASIKLDKYMEPNEYSLIRGCKYSDLTLLNVTPYQIYDHYVSVSQNCAMMGIKFSPQMLDYCISGSKLPTEQNETIVYIPKSFEIDFNVTLQDTLTVGQQYDTVTTQEGLRYPIFYNKSFTVTGIITPSTLANNTDLLQIMDNWRYNLLTPYDSYFNLIATMEERIQDLEEDHSSRFRHFRPTYLYYYKFKDTITHQNVVKASNNIIDGLRLVSRHFDDRSFELNLETEIYSYAAYALENMTFFFEFAFVLYLILSIPIIILTFILVNYSLVFINENRRDLITLLKIRGLSTPYIFIVLILELASIAIVSSVISILLGIPLSFLIGSTVGFLTFDFGNIFTIFVISPTMIQIIFIMSFLFAFISHILSAFRLARVRVDSLDEEEHDLDKGSKLDFLKGKLDIFLLFEGLLGISILLWFNDIYMAIMRIPELREITRVIEPFLTFLMLISPLSFLIGFLMLFNRFIPLLTKFTAKIFWKWDIGVISTAVNNLMAKIKITKRTTLLIAISLSFLIILSSLPLSMINHTYEDHHYRTGADLVMRISSEANVTQITDIYQNLNNISGLHITNVSRADFYYQDPGTNKLYENEMLGIEDNFAEVAHWRKYYCKKSLNTLVEDLFNSESKNNAAILDTETFKNEYNNEVSTLNTVELDEDYFANVSIDNRNIPYWPGLITKRYEHRDEEVQYIVMKRSYLKQIQNTWNAIHNVTNGESSSGPSFQVVDRIWGKIKSNANSTAVVEQIANITAKYGYDQSDILESSNYYDMYGYYHAVYGYYSSVPIFYISDIGSAQLRKAQMNLINQDPSFQFFWIAINLNFLASLIVIILVIIIFTYTRIISHAKEIGLSRALGMDFTQVFKIMFTEPIVMIVLSGIPGGFIAVIILNALVSFIGPSLSYGAPFLLDYNLPLVGLIYGIVVLMTLLTGTISSKLATRTNVSKILKVE